MGRPDGRIEKGQRLGSAISARAWNRAQDAADVVLGVTPGFEASAGRPGVSKLVFPVQIAGGTPFMYAVIGVSGAATGLNTQAQLSPYSTPPHSTGSSLPSYAVGSVGGSGSQWCICEEKLSATTTAAYCVFSGVTFARVRVRSSSHLFAIPSAGWDGTPSYSQIAGILDSTECECSGAARIISIGGSNIGSVYWAMIVL